MSWLKEEKQTDPFIEEIDQLFEWFCDKLPEPLPIHPKDKANVAQRMISVGFLRQSEWDTYLMITRDPKDND